MGAEGLFAFGIFGVFFLSVAWWNVFGGGKRERERAARLAATRGAEVRAKGWRYDDQADSDIRYRIFGGSARGVSWRIEYDSDFSSSSSTPRLHFRAPELKRASIQWQLMDRFAFGIVGSRAAKLVARGVLFMLSNLGDRRSAQAHFLEHARELPAGTTRFRERFVLLGIDPRDARLIDGEVERLILRWPPFKPSLSRQDNCFGAGLDAEGLSVSLACDGPSFEVIEHLARLGQALADRLRAA